MTVSFERLRARTAALLPVLAVLSWVGAVRGEGPFRLIAHRGGVVDEKRPENSAGALKEAVRSGYWMVEIDIQESKDGHLVVQHDDFGKSFGDKRSPGEMTWQEISKLRAKEDSSRPLEFPEYARLCRGQIRLMIDTKEPSHPPRFYQIMEQALRDNGLLDGAYFIGTAEARAYFKGKALIAVDRKQLEQHVRSGEGTAGVYFLFEHGRTLDQSAVELARRAGVPVVPSINDFHYQGLDHMKAAHADIVRMRSLGVTEFQIDAIYDHWLR